MCALLTVGMIVLEKRTIGMPSWFQGATVVVAVLTGLALLGNRRVAARDRLRHSGIEVVDGLSGVEFEHRLGALFSRQGWTVLLTPTTGDFGADLVLSGTGSKTVVQAKRYSGPVGIEAIQQVNGARTYYGADASMVVTNSRYTRAARELAVANGVTLWDRDDLIANLGGVTTPNRWWQLARKVLAGAAIALGISVKVAVAVAVVLALAVVVLLRRC